MPRPAAVNSPGGLLSALMRLRAPVLDPMRSLSEPGLTAPPLCAWLLMRLRAPVLDPMRSLSEPGLTAPPLCAWPTFV